MYAGVGPEFFTGLPKLIGKGIRTGTKFIKKYPKGIWHVGKAAQAAAFEDYESTAFHSLAGLKEFYGYRRPYYKRRRVRYRSLRIRPSSRYRYRQRKRRYYQNYKRYSRYRKRSYYRKRRPYAKRYTTWNYSDITHT